MHVDTPSEQLPRTEVSCVPRAQPAVHVASELDELLGAAVGLGVVKVSAAGSLVGGQQWTVIVTTSAHAAGVAKGPRLEDAIRQALRNLSEAA